MFCAGWATQRVLFSLNFIRTYEIGTIIISIEQTRGPDYPDHMTSRKSRDSHAISQLKSRALFPAMTMTVASGDISGLARFHWVAGCSPKHAHCPAPSFMPRSRRRMATRRWPGGMAEGTAEVHYAASRFSSPNIILLFPCSSSRSSVALDSERLGLIVNAVVGFCSKSVDYRSGRSQWVTGPRPPSCVSAGSEGTLRACHGSWVPLTPKQWDGTWQPRASLVFHVIPRCYQDPDGWLGRGLSSNWYIRSRHSLNIHMQAVCTNKFAPPSVHFSSKSFVCPL